MIQPTRVVCGILLGCLVLATQADVAHGQVSRNPARQLLRDQTFNRPTVSPYLNLLREEGVGIPTYQTLVRPQLQQRRDSQLQQQQIQRLQSDVARNAAVNQSTNLGIRPTGHTTLFRNFGNYYPRLSQR